MWSHETQSPEIAVLPPNLPVGRPQLNALWIELSHLKGLCKPYFRSMSFASTTIGSWCTSYSCQDSLYRFFLVFAALLCFAIAAHE